jgi:hypothetical protein
MSIHRHDARADAAAPEVVGAIRAEGWDVHLIRLPCDVLCWHPVLDIWQPLEIATRGGKRKADANESQRKFLRWTDVPVAYTGNQAVEILRGRYPGSASLELIATAKRIKAEFELEWKKDQSAPGARQRVIAVSGADIETNPAKPADASLSSRVAAGATTDIFSRGAA